MAAQTRRALERVRDGAYTAAAAGAGVAIVLGLALACFPHRLPGARDLV